MRLSLVRLLVALCCVSPFANAQMEPVSEESAEADASDSPAEAAEAPEYESVVTATRSTRSTFETPVGTNVVDREAIEERPSASTADLLRQEPGVSTNGEGMINVTPIIRGTMGNQNLVLVDGVRMNTAAAFGGPNTLLQTIDRENIERIEIVRGPGSVMWGTDALGGTVHIFTRAPMPWPERGVAFGGRLAATYGTVDELRRFRGEATAATPRYRLRAGYTAMDVGDLQTAGDLGVMSPSGWRARSVDARVDFRLRPTQVLVLEAQEHRVDDAQAYEISFARPSVNASVRRVALMRLESERPLPGIESSQISTYVHQQRSLGTRIDNGTEAFSQTVTLSVEGQAMSRLGRSANLTYGVHAHRDGAEAENTDGAGARTRGFPTSEWWNAAAFVSAEVRPIEKLSILPAVRLDLYHLGSDPDAESVPEGLTADEMRLSQTDVAPTGSIGVVGHVLPWMNVVASAGRGFRAPNVSDQLSSGPFRFGYEVPSPGLSPESSWDFEGGLRLRSSRFSGSATVFYTRFDNLIASELRTEDPAENDCVDVNGNGACDANEYVFVRHNVGRSHTTGVELEGTVYLPAYLSAYANGSWMTGRDDENDLPIDRLIPPNATLGVRFDPGRVYVDAWLRLVAPVSADDIPCTRIGADGGYRTDPRDPTSPLVGTLEITGTGADQQCSGDFPGHAVAGIRTGATLTSFADLSLVLSNLTNAAYREKEARFDSPGFGAFGTITIHEPRPLAP